MIRLLIAAGVALTFSILGTQAFIHWLTRHQIGQPIREDGPQGHVTKAGTPTMGGLVIVVAAFAGWVTSEIYNVVYTRREWAERSRRYWVESTGLGLNMVMTVFLGCLVGIVVVAQTLYTSTMEHIKEFGTVKAIGGSNRDIYMILAKQSTIAAVAGFALGAVQAFAMGALIASGLAGTARPAP